MGKDTDWKEYFSDNRRYADLINGIICGGRQRLQAQDLQELDSQTGVVRYDGMVQDRLGGRRRSGAVMSGVRRRPGSRDMVRKAAFGVNFAVIGIENQEIIDYSMALRNMSYDVGEYEKQIAGLRREIRESAVKPGAGEYLYGFRKDSRLHPVVTLILYAGLDVWDGPGTLHEMLDFTDMPPEMRRFVGNYRMNLVEIRKWENTGMFQTDVRQVFDFIRCAEDKRALSELVERDPYYRGMEEDAYEVVMRYANARELAGRRDAYRKEGKVDMCTAIREMMEDSRALGLTEGKALGLTEGKALGLTEGKALGLTEGKALGLTEGRALGSDEKTRRIVRNMINRGMDDADIMAIAECGPKLIREMRSRRKR